jgi:hypothetical protein
MLNPTEQRCGDRRLGAVTTHLRHHVDYLIRDQLPASVGHDALVRYEGMLTGLHDARFIATVPPRGEIEDDGPLWSWIRCYDPEVWWAARIEIDERITETQLYA